MDYYNGIAEGYDELYGEEQEKKFKKIKESFKINGLVLDVGSGTGISKKFFERVVCIDPCFKMLNKGEICGKAENLPFKKKVFDWVLCITVMQNLEDITMAIKEMKRVCNGRVVFSVLKRSNKFNKIKSLLKKEFNTTEIDEEKDLIMVSN